MSVNISNTIFWESNEIAKKFKVKTVDIQNLIIKRKLKGQKLGDKFYVSEDNLKEFLHVEKKEVSWSDFNNEVLKRKKDDEKGKRKYQTMKEVFGD